MALKAGRKDEVGSLRYLISELQKAAKDGHGALEADEELKVLRRERKRRQEAMDAFRAGGRDDLAAQEEREAGLIDEFLPTRLGPEAASAMVDQVIAESGAASLKDMGRVMSLLMERAGGQLDGKEASRMVKERLGG